MEVSNGVRSISSSRASSPGGEAAEGRSQGSLSKALGSASSLLGLAAASSSPGRPKPPSGKPKKPPTGMSPIGALSINLQTQLALRSSPGGDDHGGAAASSFVPGERERGALYRNKGVKSAANLRSMGSAAVASTSDLVGLAAGVAYKRRSRSKSKWSGLRFNAEIHKATKGGDGAPPLSPATMTRLRVGRQMSAPNLQALDMSALVKPESKHKNFRRFEDEYTLEDTLGTGGYAVVKKAKHKKSGEQYAVKIMKLAKDEDEEEEGEMQYEEIMNELSLMQQLDHPNIIKMKEYFIHRGQCYLVMDLLRGRPLVDEVYDQGRGYTEEKAKVVMRALMDAIAYMHDRNISHRDLKLENLVLKSPGDLSSVCIVDFGLAKAARLRETMEECCGTPEYAAPEIILGKPYTPAVDVWSLGIAMYTLLAGTLPFEDEDEDELDEKIVKGELLFDQPEWASVSDEAKDLLKGLLATEPKRRLSAAVALEHGWFTGFHSQDAQTLVHVHARMVRLVQSQRLPVRKFRRGEFLVHQGRRGKEVFLLTKGECELLARREGGDGGYVKVGVRRKGNFIGRLGVHFDESEMADLESRQQAQRRRLRGGVAGGSSRGSNSFENARTSGGAGGGGGSGGSSFEQGRTSDDVAGRMSVDGDGEAGAGAALVGEGSATGGGGGGVTALQLAHACEENGGGGGGGGGGGARVGVGSPTGSMASDYLCSPGSSPAMSPATTPVGSPMAGGGGWGMGGQGGQYASVGLLNVLMKVKRAWVGHRWVASVRAATDVEVTVLTSEDMQWAVEHDYRLTSALEEAVKERRKKINRAVKARKAREKREREAAEAEAAAEAEVAEGA